MVLGDGFTQSFLAATNLRSEIRCSVNDHFSVDNDLQYHPVENDRFPQSLLWTEEKWPNLYKFWLASGSPKGSDFYLNFPKVDINPTLHRGQWTFDTTALGYELRCYLWHYFRSVHIRTFGAPRIFDLRDWAWAHIVHMLLSEFSLSIHTFNYDLIVEDLIMRGFNLRPTFLIEEPDIPLDDKIANSIFLLKMHGGIAYKKTTIERIIKYGDCSNPWLQDMSFKNNTAVGCLTTFDPNMREFPLQPEIVPPGHAGGDKFHPDSRVLPLSKRCLEKSDVVIFCGLSAREPDTEEIAEMVSAIKKDALLLHVGLAADKAAELSQLFKSSGLTSVFVEVGREGDIPSMIGKKLPLKAAW